MNAATSKRRQGGWAATLKAAGQQGLPVSMDDPRYLDRYKYVSALMGQMHMKDPYGDAIRARGWTGIWTGVA